MHGDSHTVQWREIGTGKGFLGFSEGVIIDTDGVTGGITVGRTYAKG